MAIKKPVKVAEDAFIEGAPDAEKTKGVIRGKKQIITVGFAPDLLERIDGKAAERIFNHSRAECWRSVSPSMTRCPAWAR